MPQFYETDDINCWVKVLIMERWDALDANERADFKSDIDTMEKMRCWVREHIQEIYFPHIGSFLTAILNSVDWEEVFAEAFAYIQDPNN